MKKKFINFINDKNDINIYNKRDKNIYKKVIFKDDEIKMGEKKIILSNSQNIEPIIKVNKEGGIVQQLEITCKCGEKIYVDFNYE